MNSAEIKRRDPPNDDIEPPSTKKLKFSTDTDNHLPPLAQDNSSSIFGDILDDIDVELLVAQTTIDHLNVPGNDNTQMLEEEKLVRSEIDDSKEDRNGNESRDKVDNQKPNASDTKSQPVVTTVGEDQAKNEENKFRSRSLDPSFHPVTGEKRNIDNTTSILPPSTPNPLKATELSSPSSPTEKRREALRGIVMGIKSPVTRAAIGYECDRPAPTNLLPASKVTAMSIDDGSKVKQMKVAEEPVKQKKPAEEHVKQKKSAEEHHEVKRRAPRKDPKPRLPLENRVFYSKKEMDSATSFFEGKEDLCDCLPLDDCFLLGEMFWIFTVKQLELALDESSERASQNLIKEMIAKIPSAPIESAFAKSNALGSSLMTTPSPQAPVSSIVDLSASEELECDSDTLMIEKSDDDKHGMSQSSESRQLIDLQPSSVDQTKLVPINQGLSVGQGIASMDAELHISSGSDKITAISDIESISKVTAPLSDTKMTQQDSEHIPNGEVRIKERISFWRQAISIFRDKGTTGSTTEVQKRFRLDGPIKILFPQATLNFFKSIRLETLWTFLALRKSETGAICDLMHIWRRECKMSVVPDIGLGRHFLAIAARVETVLTAFPPIPESDRGWILDPISGITGAAREFLIRDHKIMSGIDFLNIKTKQLADVLEVWRQEKGMEKLRGSGKVAMISAWKAFIKEALEVENDSGIVLDLSRYVAMVDNNVPMTTIISSNSKQSDTSVPSKTNQKMTSDLALHSKMALERVLGDGATALLRSGGIQTAAELFAVEMSTESLLYRTLMKTGIVDDMPAFTKAVQKWREKINQYLKNETSEDNVILNNLETPYVKVVPYTPSVHKESAVGSASSTHLSTTAKSNLRADAITSRPMTSPQTNKSIVGDPVYNTLSYTTQQFLASMGIHTAKDFLKTRSSELAVNFVPWRRSMGKPELKGMGSIASISGWKSQVRKKAKEMGLDELAELEPSTRGAKSYQLPNTHSQEKLAYRDEFESNAVDFETEMDTTLCGEGLATTNTELFSVQHQGIDYQSVFELSARPDAISMQERHLFVTFKGFTCRKPTKFIAERIELNIKFDANHISEKNRPVYILSDVPVSNKKKCPIEGNDGLSWLVSSPSSISLIDISLHGAYPYLSQNLEMLKMAMEQFVMKGHYVKLDECAEHFEEVYNVIVRKVRLNCYQYLLYVPIPLESGHTIKVVFPSIQTTFSLQNYPKSEFPIMHKIDESLATLTVSDLRTLMAWLHDKVPTLISNGETDNETLLNVETVVRRRRFYWLERQIFVSMERRNLTLSDLTINENYVFKSKLSETGMLYQDVECSNSLIDEIEMELRYALEQDVTCGLVGSQGWSAVDKHYFDDIIKCVAQCLSKYGNEGCEWSPLLELINAIICPEMRGQKRHSMPIGHNGSDCLTQIDEAATNTEKIFNNAAESPTSVVSPSFIWQVVNSAFDVLRIDMFLTKDSDNLSTCLSSIHAVLFDTDSIVQDPILVKYNEELCYASPMPKSDIDYTPNTKMLFVGLVWPVLRNYGWCIIVDKDSNDVSYVPASVSQKHSGAVKHLRDQQKVKSTSKRGTKAAGFHLIRKTAKRLFVAITNETHDDDDTEVAYDKQYTVEAVLDKFLASLCGRFSTMKDAPKFKVKDVARKVVSAIGELFDSCALMLAPISKLSPCWNVDGENIIRPISAYRCEYLIPFLFSFVSKVKSQASFDTAESVVRNALLGLACDLLTYISLHYQEFFDKSFQPPIEEYVASESPTLWFETNIHALLLENELRNQTTDISTNKEEETNKMTDDLSTETEPFQILLDEEKDQVTDFIRITLENTKPIFSRGDELRRKNTRPVGAPGLVCRHCLGKYGEGKYFFSSMESLSTCYPVLEKHYHKCPDTPPAIKNEIADARALHTQQRRLRQSGTQQAVFVKLWNRMMKCSKTAISSLQNGPSNFLYNNEDDTTEDIDENSIGENELVFTDHRAVIDYLRSNDSNHSDKWSKTCQQEINDALDTYYACIEYAGRIYGTTSMPKHFSTRWLLHKMTALGQISSSPIDSKPCIL